MLSGSSSLEFPQFYIPEINFLPFALQGDIAGTQGFAVLLVNHNLGFEVVLLLLFSGIAGSLFFGAFDFGLGGIHDDNLATCLGGLQGLAPRKTERPARISNSSARLMQRQAFDSLNP